MWYDAQNRNAIIRTRETSGGKLRTETARRDAGMNATVTTDPRSNATRLTVSFEDSTLRLNGRSARTLFRLLAKHYAFTDKSLDFNE